MILNPLDRYEYDAASLEQRQKMMDLMMSKRLEPPLFLRFALNKIEEVVTKYPGASPESEGLVANGTLSSNNVSGIAKKLGITENQLTDILSTFHGKVTFVGLEPGQKLYRTIGLTTSRVDRGLVTNPLLGGFYAVECPNQYQSIEEWRSANAVKCEWNGDYGYIEVIISKTINALLGTAGQQEVQRDDEGNKVLKGGATQLFIPNLTDEYLTESITDKPLSEIIKQTIFGQDRQ